MRDMVKRRRLQERYQGRPISRSLLERVQAANKGEQLEWDPERKVIKNLCMLSSESRNGRTYTPQSLEDVKGLYEGARAYQDHPSDPTAHRSTKERIGRWENVRIVDGKVRGDLAYDPYHPYANSLIWAAQHCPEHCGISHNVEAEGYEDENGHFTVTKVVDVRSVDVVDDAATNRSLLEGKHHKHRRKVKESRRSILEPKHREGAMDPEELDDGMGDGEDLSPEHHLGEYISACFHDPNMSKDEKKKKIVAVLDKLLDDDGEMDMEEDEEDGEVEVDPEYKARKPRGQEKEQDEPDIATEERDREDEEEEEGPMMARESLEKLRRHKDRNVRRLVETAIRNLPRPRRIKVRRRATESVAHSDPEVRRALQRLDVLELEKITRESLQRALLECRKAGLPKRAMGRTFMEDLANCTDARRRRAMIQERARVASIQLPRSFGATGASGSPRLSNAEFAAMVDGVMD